MLLIDELKNEHKIIMFYLEEAKSNYSSKPEVSRQKLLLAKDVLINHLKKEDKMLYPILNKEAESNSPLKNYLDTFAKDMENITKLIITFFEKNRDSISSDFSDDFAKISFELKSRVGKEERVLYKAYENINTFSNVSVLEKNIRRG